MEKTCRLVHITYKQNDRGPGREEYNVVEPVHATRQSLKLNLWQYKLHNKKYTNSPYIRGKGLWDKLPWDVQYL